MGMPAHSLAVVLQSKITVANDFGLAVDDPAIRYTETLADGTGASQGNQRWSDTRTLAASANEDLDLNGASILNALGVALAFTKVKEILIVAAAGNTNSVVIKPGAANGLLGPFGAATHTITLPPGGKFLVTAPVNGWTVTPSTADLINIANSGAGTSVNYDIHVVGVA